MSDPSQLGARPKTTTTTTTTTTTITEDEENKKKAAEEEKQVRLKLQKRDSKKSVNWTEDTIDNENMGKKKSKCCCVYVKPKAFDQDSSDDDDGDDNDECDHCSGHHGKDLNKKSEDN